MANVGPFAQGGLDEAFRLAVGAGSVGTGEAVLDAELEASGAELSGTIAGAVVGEQAADGDLLIAGHALDVEMQQIAGSGMLVAHDRRSRMQMTPAVQLSAPEDATDGGRTEMGAWGV